MSAPSASAPPGAGGGFLGLMIAPVFVLLWSTGFIGAKYGLPYAEPLTFLALRFGIVTVALALAAPLLRAEWPARSLWPRIAWIGVLMHAGYLAGVFIAISMGLSAGLAALITSLTPLATAVIARQRFGEYLTSKQMIGMTLGLIGVALAVGGRVEASWSDAPAVALCLLAALALALGAVEQRSLGATPMLSGNLIQFAAATLVLGVGALAFETREVDWNADFVLALGWLAIVLSIGAISLFYILLRRGAAAEATSLVFLTPPATAVIAWAIFGETLGLGAVLGFALASLGVALTTRRI